jgi:hypothetical protein
MPAFGGIAIPAQQSSLRERETSFLLYFLGTDAQKFKPATPATRASLRNGHPVIALMANKLIRIIMISQSNIAAPAAKDKAADTALDEAGGSPAIKKKNHLPTASYRFDSCFVERTAKQAHIPHLKLITHIHNFDTGEG